MQTEAQLLQVMVQASANALESYSLNNGVITNLDGLAATTNFENNEVEEAMDINKVNDPSRDNCFNCSEIGHHAVNCPHPKKPRKGKVEKKEDGRVPNCAFCDAKGHHHSVCRKKKAYKEEQSRKRAVKKTEEDEEEQEYDIPSEEEEEGEGDEEEEEVNVIYQADFPISAGHPRGHGPRRY